MPTIGDYLPRVRAAAGPGAGRTYGIYWSQMAIAWRDRPLTAIAASDVEALQRRTIADAVPRRSSRGGRHAGEHLIAAARAMFNRAIAHGYDSLAHRVVKPRRLPSPWRALMSAGLPAVRLTVRVVDDFIAAVNEALARSEVSPRRRSPTTERVTPRSWRKTHQ